MTTFALRCRQRGRLALLAGGLLATISVGPAPAAEGACRQTPPRVAVDIGHTLKRPGAISARGKREFQFNQRFANELAQIADQDKTLQVVLINADGRIGGLRARVEKAEKIEADVFLSIHHDSAQRQFFQPWIHEGKQRFFADQFSGFSLFVSRMNPGFDTSVRLAKQIADAWLAIGIARTLHHAAPIKGENRELLDRRRGVYEAPFLVVREATMPAVLVEVGVLVNRDEEQRLETTAYRKRMQVALLHALKRFCSFDKRIENKD